MLADRSTMNLDLTGRWVQEGYNNCTLAGRSAVIIFFWSAGTRWGQYMSADRSAMNLDLTGWWVQEGYNNSTLAGRSAVIISFLASRY